MNSNFETEIDRLSYAMGMNMGEYLTRNPLKINTRMALEGIRDFLAHSAKLTPQEYVGAMQTLRNRMEEATQKAVEKLAADNIAAEKAFLAGNREKANVRTTQSGLQYEVITEGKGPRPAATDKVRVHYTGTLLNGTEFDSSVRRGEPAEFGVDQVIPGWTEALQLMSVGSKYRLYIPAKLGYGERGAGQAIPPNATLIFDVELLDIL